MNCGECDTLLDAWEEGAELGPDRLRELVAHIGLCPNCRQGRAALVPLLERDIRESIGDISPGDDPSGEAAIAEAGQRAAFGSYAPSAAARDVADAVMARLGAPAPRRRVGALAPRRRVGAALPSRDIAVRRKATRQGAAREVGSAERRQRWAIPAVAALLALGLGLGTYFGLRDPGMVTVHFVLNDPTARSVALAGDFTGWKGQGLQLHRETKTGEWELTVKLRKGGLYAYNFIVDGEKWIPDPSVPERIEDGFGGSSSLLRL